ncbi:hypothetical protein [Olivibacter sp. XZL3]|uniref:hypothetical protein n=1 Tax=Olivibacter sp. XZL3 TaxID=1735116 RepID=UPI001065B662|nr:hypothetical protein [Olivibacter sp. XZL3]
MKTNRRRKVSLAVIMLTLLCANVFAGTNDTDKNEKKRKQTGTVKNDAPFIPAFGVNVGTQGVGLQFYGPIGGNFGFQVGGTFLPLSANIFDRFGSYDTRNRIRGKAGNVRAMIEFAPAGQSESWWKHFVISAGAAYFYKADGYINTMLRDPYQYGDIQVPVDKVGEMVTNVSWKNNIAPYLGIGFRNITIDERFGFSFDLGSYYMDSPEIDLYGTRMLQNNQHNEAILNENLKDYRFYPVLQVGVSYKLK